VPHRPTSTQKTIYPRVLTPAALALLTAFAANADDTRKDTAHDLAYATRVSDRILSAMSETSGVPGFGAAVWRDGRIVWRGSSGMRDLEARTPVTADTVFRLASVSKVIAATAAAKLREEGKLDVDVPITTRIPGLRADWSAMTPRHLAAHLSGLPHYQDADDDRGGKHYPTVMDAVGIFKDRPLLSTPGTRYEYSSWGYTLLSAGIEQAASEPFLAYLHRDITGGLTIGADATDGDDENASHAYEFVDGILHRAAPHDYSYTWAGGGLGATPSALATFGGRLMGGKIVSSEAFEWMLTPTRLANDEIVRDNDSAVGFGWRIGKDGDGARIAHHGGVTVGARSALVLWPERSMAVSLLSNALWVASIEQSAMTLAAPFEPAPPTLTPSACPTVAVRYQGTIGEDTVAGNVRFSIKDGICIGRLTVDDVLRKAFDRFPQKDADTLFVVGIDAAGGLSRAALVTPIGAYDLRAGADGTHAAKMSATRSIRLRFEIPPRLEPAHLSRD
jgi:serine beta-lactamase-like protein LACTB, mitochondrial